MPSKKTPFFELRSGAVETLHFVVKSTEMGALRAELAQRFVATPEFFSNEAVAIDVRRLDDPQSLPLPELVDLLRTCRMNPIGVVAHDAPAAWLAAGGLPLLDSQERRPSRGESAQVELTAPVSAEGAAVETESAPESGARDAAQTLIIDKPLRSGQQIYAKGDVVVLDVVNCGAEVIAEGNIHVYAPLRGRALAGVHGNHGARIFCTCLEPELISIAGIYRTTENALPENVMGRSVQVRLRNDKLIFEPLRLK
ncbi:septation inhibitor protein [Pandoraea thiooxydans]|uniref:Probable septum site-determining protein MinC n=1 Tax=Pandoraea thiooxydans TaxID=445709 RepID=A0A0G3ELC7_9BURK|nr:septum site-determining protein MinC [Pandoraea thiooxydans]AKJ67863.1 septum site-determining protein MinC [Pandoraea thiooxydans]APR95057.1 septation inhibitor protein [Pandoraea thiooxydans]